MSCSVIPLSLGYMIEVNNYDTECAHINADEIICELLQTLGYKEVVKAYDEVTKWYA